MEEPSPVTTITQVLGEGERDTGLGWTLWGMPSA